MIKFIDASFAYKKHQVYQKVNIQLSQGKIYGLLGKNGEGKSTFLRCICGLLFPTHGTIEVRDSIPQNREPNFLSDIFFIPENVNLPNLRISKYVETYGAFYPNFSNEDFLVVLKEMGLKRTQSLKSLSHGQQKKVLIAFALATHVKTLLMDEPTNGLDIPSKSQFRKLIASFLNEEKTFIISTHQVKDIENLIDHVLILNHGKIILDVDLHEISHRLVSRTVPKSQLNDDVLIYHEDTLEGCKVLERNRSGVGSQVDLEHLFSAAVLQTNRLIDQLQKSSEGSKLQTY